MPEKRKVLLRKSFSSRIYLKVYHLIHIITFSSAFVNPFEKLYFWSKSIDFYIRVCYNKMNYIIRNGESGDVFGAFDR